jgi:hopanoid biosynthesis associated protein HpnK
MRRLIVNADDFGYTAGINRAIAEAHTGGIVTSSTLMAGGAAFDDAIRWAKQLPRLSVGCHVVLIDGVPVLDPSRLPTLTSKNSLSAAFRDGLKSFAARALAGRLDSDEIENEITAQIRKIQAAGVDVSHLDSHKHTHLFPAVLRPLLRSARASGVRAIRNPFGPRRPPSSAEWLARPRLWTRYAEVRILSALAGKFRAAVKKEGLLTPDGTLGIVVTGVLDERLFRAIAAAIPEGTWEFVCHPGYNDADLQRANTRLRRSREAELRVLTMPQARELLNRNGVTLISYADFAAQRI